MAQKSAVLRLLPELKLTPARDTQLQALLAVTQEDGHANLGRSRDCAVSPDLPGNMAFSASAVRACAFSPDGARLLSGSSDRTLRLWDARSGQLLRTLPGHSHEVLACAFSPDGATLVSASHDGTFRLWDALTGTELRRHLALRDAWATLDHNGVLACSEEAWRYLRWDVGKDLLPAESYGPLPVVE